MDYNKKYKLLLAQHKKNPTKESALNLIAAHKKLKEEEKRMLITMDGKFGNK